VRRRLALRPGSQVPDAKQCIDLLVDIVSRNGTLLAEFPLKSDGTLDSTEMGIIAEITAWMAVTARASTARAPGKFAARAQRGRHHPGHQCVQAVAAIPDTSPGCHALVRSARQRQQAVHRAGRALHDQGQRSLRLCARATQRTARPPRKPRHHVAQLEGRKVADVSLLGYGGKLDWSQTAEGLVVKLPEQLPSEHAIALKIAGVVGA